MPKQLRVSGHELVDEGAPFSLDGWAYWPRRGTGHGKCRCGLLSPELPSEAARKRWHRQHKEEVLRKQSQ